MSLFWVLLHTMARHYFSLSVIRERLRRRQDLWKMGLALLGVLAFGVPVLYGYVKLLQATYQLSAQLNQPGIVVVFGMLTVQLVVLIFGMFYVISVFYYSSDIEFLVPMPFRPETILGAKFGIVLLTEYITALPIAVPPLIIYGLNQQGGPTFWLGALVVVALLPLLPLAIAAIVSVALMRFTSLARNRDALRITAGLLLVVLALAFQWYVSRLGMQGADPDQVLSGLLTAPNSLVTLVGKRFPPALWGALALTSSGTAAWRYLLAYLVGTTISIGLLWWVARRFFYTGLLQNATQARTKHHKRRNLVDAVAWRTPLAALMQREWLLLVRTPMFAMTAGLNLFLPPILLALPILGAGEQLVDMRMALASPRFPLYGSLGVAALFAALGPLAAIAPTAVSREGQLFWISRTIPVPPTLQLRAKLMFAVLLVLVSAVLMVVVAVPLIGVSLPMLWPGMILGVLGLVLTSAIGLAVDAWWPRLDWQNPQQAMKGNQNVLVAMGLVALLGYGLVRSFLWVLRLGWSDTAILVALGALLLVLTAVVLQVLRHIGHELYSPKSLQKGNRPGISRAQFWRKNGRSLINIVVVVAVAFFIGQQLFTARNLEYKFDADAIRFGKVELPYSAITEVRYLEHIPTLSGRVGTSLGNYHSGTFTVAGIGRGRVIATDATKPALLLRTAKTFYIITPDNAAARYQEVLQKVEQPAGP